MFNKRPIIHEDADLSYDDIGTSDDTGSLAPGGDGEYGGEKDTEYDTFDGLALAIVKGPLQAKVMSAPEGSNVLVSLVYQMLERKSVSDGDAVSAAENLCFTPDADDLYNGARIQFKNGYIIAHDGTRQQVFKYDTEVRLLTKFVRAGAFVLAGMVNTLAQL